MRVFSPFFFFKQKTAYNIPLSPLGSEMCIRAHAPPPPTPLLEWVDWCLYVFRATPQQVTRRSDGQGLRLDFPPLAPNQPRFAELSLCPTAPVTDRPTLDEVRLHCERGDARMLGPTSIGWSVDGSPQSEELTAERIAEQKAGGSLSEEKHPRQGCLRTDVRC